MPPPYAPFGRWIGVALLLNYLVAVAAKLAADKGPELFWMSHVGLLMAAAGLIARQRWLVAAALTGVAFIHLMWIADALVGLTTGDFPLDMAEYLTQGDYRMWLGTSHHFYLVPLLVFLILRDGEYPWTALPGAMAVFSALTLISRYALPERDNVNCVFGIKSGPANPVVAWLNDLEGPAYLLALNAAAAVILFLPVTLVMWGLTALRRRSARTTPP